MDLVAARTRPRGDLFQSPLEIAPDTLLDINPQIGDDAIRTGR
jgi:hypothetical protein